MKSARMTSRWLPLAAVIFASLFLPTAASAAVAGADVHYLVKPVQKKREISRDQAAAMVKRRYGGKILAISEVQRNGRSNFRIKGLSGKSQVYVVFVDRATGKISK